MMWLELLGAVGIFCSGVAAMLSSAMTVYKKSQDRFVFPRVYVVFQQESYKPMRAFELGAH